MDLSWLLDLNISSTPSPRPSGPKAVRLDETACGSFCQHPSCWASQRRQEKGIPRVLPPIDVDSDSSDDDIHLPTQSIVNLLGDYGDNSSDRYPLSTGGRPSHQWDTHLFNSPQTAESFNSGCKLTAPHNTTISTRSKRSKASRGLVRNPRLRLVEVQEVFDKDDLNKVWDETFVTKQYYVWVPNPKRCRKTKRNLGTTDTSQSHPVLMKDLTESMVPSEIEHKREETVLFDEWPVLKKKQQRTRSPPPKAVSYKRVAHGPGSIPDGGSIDTDGINELLALPRETLIKVLEQTKKSDFTSKGKLHSIVQECARNDEHAKIALTARELFQHKQVQLAEDRGRRADYSRSPNPRPVFQMDDDRVIDRMSSANTPVKEKDTPYSDAGSMDSFPRYKHALPGISGDYKGSRIYTLNNRTKIPSISLGLPELPSGVKTTRPFTYKNRNLDFSLGPVISPPSSYRSSQSGTYSDHGTTLKVNISSTAIGHLDSNYNREIDGMAIHSVSPAFSTHVPVPPAGTPATFQSPTKSAPVFRDYRDITRDPSHMTVNWSQHAQPPSRERDAREDTMLSSPAQMTQTLSPMEHKPGVTPDDQGLDTINETARENQDGSVSSSHLAGTDKGGPTPTWKGDPAPPTLQLETSMLKSIDTAASPRQKSARSVESCPSPEQWPLISESSFERLPRPSMSEPALSARSDRRRPMSQGRDEAGKNYARKVLDEKMQAESPAPPPPSPEPKEPGEYRSRKDLRSRDSLSMAPLFEVTELEEGSPVKELEGTRKQEQSRKIEVKIPREKDDSRDRKTERDEHQDGELVSQITVMHVTPKGRDPNKKKEYEKVQETFLNVDIPAEEISSLKAEHGSSHQEDISSNDTVVMSHSTTTGSESSPTPRGQGSEVKGHTVGEEEEAGLPAIDEHEQAKSAAEHELNLEDKQQEEEEEEKDGDSLKENLNLSGESPELMCDSARFLSHDLVSPIEGDKELETSQRFVLGGLEQEMESENQGDGKPEEQSARSKVIDDKPDDTQEESLTARADAPGTSEAEGEETGDGDVIKAKEDELSPEVEIPGSFFFMKSSSNEEMNETAAEDKTQVEGQTEVETQTKEPEETVQAEVDEGSDKMEAVFVGSKPTDETEGNQLPQDDGNDEEVAVSKPTGQEMKGEREEPTSTEVKHCEDVAQPDTNIDVDASAEEAKTTEVDGETTTNEVGEEALVSETGGETVVVGTSGENTSETPQAAAVSSSKEPEEAGKGDSDGNKKTGEEGDGSVDGKENVAAHDISAPSEPKPEEAETVQSEEQNSKTDETGDKIENVPDSENAEELPSREDPEGAA